MKKILIVQFAFIAFFSLVFASEDDGWSSSGGGEFVTDEYNPWFFKAYSDNKSKVRWCIEHGGDDYFSLSYEESKLRIEKSLKRFEEEINQYSHEMNYLKKSDRGYTWHHVAFGMLGVNDNQNKALRLNVDFEFMDKCQEDTELTVILGNHRNEAVKKVIQKNGPERFKKIAGVAIRTSYDYLSQIPVSKGFIYIAADKGEFSYSGVNFVERGGPFWNKQLNADVELPEKNKMNPNFDINKNIFDPFSAVFLHEIGHVYGFKHTHPKASNRDRGFNDTVKYDSHIWFDGFKDNIMSEDFPARVISEGGVPRNSLIAMLSHFGPGINKLQLLKMRNKVIQKPIRIGFKLKYHHNIWDGRKQKIENLEEPLKKYLMDRHSLMLAVGPKKTNLYSLRLSQKIYSCVKNTDYPSEVNSNTNFNYKNLEECRSYYRNLKSKDFSFKKNLVTSQETSEVTTYQKSKSGVFAGFFEKAITNNQTIELLSRPTIIPFYDVEYSLKVDIIGEDKTYSYLFRFVVNGDFDEFYLQITNLETLKSSRVYFEGISFVDNKLDSEELPLLY